jgi:amidase
MFEGTDPGLVAALSQVLGVLKSLGAQLVPLTMPTDGPMELRNAWLPVTAYEAYKAHQATYPAKADQYGGYLGDVLKMGMSMSQGDYAAAHSRRLEIARRFEAKLDKVDAVICPSGGSVFKAEKALQYGNMETMKPIIKHFQGQFTIPADLAGTPALTVPCGFSAEDTPFAVQFLGRKLSEAILCRIGMAFESATEWHLHHPVV